MFLKKFYYFLSPFISPYPLPPLHPTHNHLNKTFYFFFFKKLILDFIYLFLKRGEGRERDIKRNIDV